MVTNAFKRFYTAKGGTAYLKRRSEHYSTSNKRKAECLPIGLGASQRRKVADSATVLVVHGLFPLRFVEGNRGMTEFVKALFLCAQNCLVSQSCCERVSFKIGRGKASCVQGQ